MAICQGDKIMKKLIAVAALCAVGSAMASNEIYIEQVGSGFFLDVVQLGNGNRIGTESVPMMSRGSNNSVEISQIGNDNSIAFKMDAQSATVSMFVTGSSNMIDFSCGWNGANCGGHDTQLTILGSSNSFTAAITASDVTNNIRIEGDSNIFNIATASRANNMIDFTGSTNTLDLVQNGVAGVLGNSVNLTHVGGNSTFNVTQQGSVDNSVTINNIGNDVSVTINQGN
jgi:hypothetical protein